MAVAAAPSVRGNLRFEGGMPRVLARGVTLDAIPAGRHHCRRSGRLRMMPGKAMTSATTSKSAIRKGTIPLKT